MIDEICIRRVDSETDGSLGKTQKSRQGWEAAQPASAAEGADR